MVDPPCGIPGLRQDFLQRIPQGENIRKDKRKYLKNVTIQPPRHTRGASACAARRPKEVININ